MHNIKMTTHTHVHAYVYALTLVKCHFWQLYLTEGISQRDAKRMF